MAAGLRWLLVRELLARLDEVAADAPRVAHCRSCFQLGDPPPSYRLYVRLQEGGQNMALGRLSALLGDLRQAPWPFNALAARAHVAVCALTRVTSGTRGCWPVGTGIGGRDEVEVRAMALAFRGQHGNAWLLMEQSPAWFAGLDSLRDFVDRPEDLVGVPRGERYAPTLPMREAGPRLSVATLWKGAWPLYLLPFNERLVVHRARLLLADVVWRLGSEGRQGLFDPFGIPRSIVAVGVPLGVAIAGDREQVLVYYPEGTHETAPQTSSARRVGVGPESAIPAGISQTHNGAKQFFVIGLLGHRLIYRLALT